MGIINISSIDPIKEAFELDLDLIKEERNTLTDKEIYLLQKLANKK